jgi:hypothetical protein
MYIEWDDLVRIIKSLSREIGFPIGAESNFVLKLFEEYAEDNAPFPPKQMIIARPLDDSAQGAHWLRILCTVLVSKQCNTYTELLVTKKYQGLRGLCLWGTDVGDAGTKHLCEIALPLLPHCCKLELIDCGIGVKGCEYLGISLKQRRSTHLKILRLDHNPSIGAQGVARLSEGLYFNSFLTTLSLAYCDIGNEGGVFLQNIVMTRDIGIQTLNLEGNRLERDGVMALAQGLLVNRSLTNLSLASNSFGGGGQAGALASETDAVRYLVAGMSAVKSLKNVNLDGNLIGSNGIALLHQAAISGALTHVIELAVTPFAACDIYKALVDQIESHKPVKVKKKKRRSTKKKT